MFDIVIANGMIIDPEALTRRKGNVGIRDGKIAAVTQQQIHGVQEFDVVGKTVCPGFIDIHGHVDWDDYCGELSLSLIHISEPTRRTPISYAVFCLKKKKKK